MFIGFINIPLDVFSNSRAVVEMYDSSVLSHWAARSHNFSLKMSVAE